MLTESRERATGMVAEAQQKKAGVLEDLGKRKSLLDRTIEELRGFEKNYRSNLKSYIEGQLHDLDKGAHEPTAPTEHAEHAETVQEDAQPA